MIRLTNHLRSAKYVHVYVNLDALSIYCDGCSFSDCMHTEAIHAELREESTAADFKLSEYSCAETSLSVIEVQEPTDAALGAWSVAHRELERMFLFVRRILECLHCFRGDKDRRNCEHCVAKKFCRLQRGEASRCIGTQDIDDSPPIDFAAMDPVHVHEDDDYDDDGNGNNGNNDILSCISMRTFSLPPSHETLANLAQKESVLYFKQLENGLELESCPPRPFCSPNVKNENNSENSAEKKETEANMRGLEKTTVPCIVYTRSGAVEVYIYIYILFLFKKKFISFFSESLLFLFVLTIHPLFYFFLFFSFSFLINS